MSISGQNAAENVVVAPHDQPSLNIAAAPERKRPAHRINTLFDEQVARTPKALALINGPISITFETLKSKADALAHALISAGLKPGASVGVLVHRSADLPQACLAIYKAGGIYVPLVADHPVDRLNYMIDQANINHVIILDGLTLPDSLTRTPQVLRPESLAINDNQHACAFPNITDIDARAAILFTSGSTGRPKGVELSHRAIVNMVQGHIEEHKLVATDRILLSSSPGFILGFREVHLTFMTGAAHVAINRDQLDDPDQVIKVMEEQAVSVALFTPSYLKILNHVVPKGLRLILTAGERPNLEDARHYAQFVEYWNCHGSTETCGTYAMYQVSPDTPSPLPSGKAFPNATLLLLDENKDQVGDEEEGEIYILSPGLANGYLNQPDLTADNFVQTKWGRAYRTKDFGRWDKNGNLIALGRSDDVVKIDGQAVTLSEIEHALKDHPNVNQAVALLVNGRLTGAMESKLSPAPSLDYWRGFLTEKLPGYMIPAHFICLDKMPVSSAGKADRMKIAELAANSFSNRDEGTLPESAEETALAAAWMQVLGLDTVFLEDNFFSLGGTSLGAIQVSLQLKKAGLELAPHTLLAHPVLQDQAHTLRPLQELSLLDEKEGLASAVQCDFWTAWKLGRSQAGSVVSRVLVAEGNVGADAQWQAAWQQLSDRHPALRTEFFEAPDETLRWRIKNQTDVDFSIETASTEDKARALLDQQFAKPINLDDAPLVRAGLVRVEENAKTLFWFVLHHSVVDGLSAQVLQNELFDILCGNDLPAVGNGTALSSHIEKQYLDSLDADTDRQYWQDILESALSTQDGEAFSDYGVDKRRPLDPSGTIAKPFYQTLSPEEVSKLEQLARLNGVGLHSLLLALLAHETRRRTGKETVVIGSGITNQPAGNEAVVGLFVNLVPTVLDRIEGQITPADDFKRTQMHMGEVGQHAHLPATEIVSTFRTRHPDVRPMRTTLFDISFTANPSRYNSDDEKGLSLQPWRRNTDTLQPAAGLELAFHHEMRADGSLELGLVWNPDVYYEETASDWLAGFAGWARWVAADLTRANAALPALLPDEEALLQKWENGPANKREDKRFNELFSDLVKQAPDHPAVISNEKIITRAELEIEANRIANGLVENGIKAGDVVAVLTGSNMILPSVILGVWKAGAHYLPLALDVPSERQAYIADDAGAEILICVENAHVPDNLVDRMTKVLRPEDLGQDISAVNVPAPHDDVAYIIYTSGTTGRPKGVLCCHDGMNNAIFMTEEAIGFNADDRIAMAASSGFDASLWELGMGLLLGGAVVPISHELRDDPWAMKQYYRDVGVTIAFHAPSYVRISRDEPFGSLRALLTGGETPSHEDLAAHGHELDFFNAYGPTETSIIVSLTHVPADTSSDRALHVGRPGANEVISIRRDDGSPVPPGTIGEVWLGGVGVGKGYLNKPDLTADRFVLTDNGRFYRTGDLGRWTTDGKLELAGRMDHQVKLHGQRLELEEIEQAVAKMEEVAEAVILLHEAAAGTKTLQAFVRLNDGQDLRTPADWRATLGEHLPPYMIPAAISVVDHIPVNQSGKLDRNALLALAPQESQPDDLTPPMLGIESTVAEVWQDMLNVSVHREDNFFALGGNSLLAVTIAHRLSKQLNRQVAARDLFGAPTLSGFAEKVAASAPASADAAERSDIATEGEREFWTAEQAGLDTRTFIILVQQDVHGDVPSAEIWDEAWAKVVARHGALRTYYREDGEGILRRRLVGQTDAKLAHTVVADQQTLREMVRKWQSEPLAMEQAPLWRAGVISERETGTTTFWLALHHAVGDGRSVGIILHDMASFIEGIELTPLETDLDETGAAYNAYLEGPAAEEDRAYWKNIMAPVPDVAFDENPLDMSREETPYIGTHRIKTYLDADTAKGLYQIASDHKASMHALMLTLLALETKRRTGREEFVLGTTASSRETAEDNEVVGCFVNMLPLPYQLNDDIVFGDLLEETQQALMGALQHERFPFAQIYHDVWAERPHLRHPLRFPLFDFVVTENPAPEVIGGVFTRPAVVGAEQEYEYTDWPPGQDMVLIHERQPDGSLLMEWHVNAEVYQRDTSETWFKALADWARWLGQNPVRAGDKLPALLPFEEEQLLSFEQGPVRARPDHSVHELFEKHVLNTPEAAAIRKLDGVISYNELDQAANKLAHGLLNAGLKSGDVVAVLSDRSAELSVAMMAVWKAGGIYLPLAADLPGPRLTDMAADAQADILIVLDNHEIAPDLKNKVSTILHLSDLDNDLPATKPQNIKPCETAYILFTSGSTGRPKGTKVGHRAYVNLVMGMIEEYDMTTADRTLMFSSPSFDVSLSDIGVPLSVGASLSPVSYETLSAPKKLVEMINQLEITIVDITPTYLRLLDGVKLPSVRILVTGGEAPFAQDVAIYAKRHKYYNAYGPTENTITSSLVILDGDKTDSFTCGTPLPNTLMEIRNEAGVRLPFGMMGEVWLGGENLAEGYLNRPGETKHAFINTADGRRYRTGDLGKWHADGQLELLGRIDDQVKLNGIRVETSEIEAVISQHPHIAQTAVIVDRTDSRSHKLYAFIKLEAGRKAPEEDFWGPYLKERLPAYMIPTAIIPVDDIKVTHAGKVDKKVLLDQVGTRTQNDQRTKPTDAVECLVADVWRSHLNCGDIHLEDNFFSLGGHSLLAIAVANDLENKLNYPVPARELFTVPTLAGFSERVRLAEKAEQDQAKTSDLATEGQREFWIAEQAGHDTRGFNLALTLTATGTPPSPKIWSDAWKKVIQRHNVFSTIFFEDTDGLLRTRHLSDMPTILTVSHARDFNAVRDDILTWQSQPFKMDEGPLWRAGLVILEDASVVFWLSLHHAIGDGWSLGIIAQELEAALRGTPMDDAQQSFDVAAAKEVDYLQSKDCADDRRYWMEMLEGLAQTSHNDVAAFDEWPLDHKRPTGRVAQKSKGSHCLRLRLSADIMMGLQDLARKNDASLHAVMLSLMAMEVQRKTSRSAFALGTVASRRESKAEADCIGYYINMLPVACHLENAKSFDDIIRHMQKNLASGLTHQRYPFGRISKDFNEIVDEPRHPARMPVFDFAVTENPAVEVKDIPTDWSLSASHTKPSDHAIKYELRPAGPAQDIVLIHEGRHDGSRDLILFVNANLYEQQTAENWLTAINYWAEQLGYKDLRSDSPLPKLTQTEKAWLEDRHGEKQDWPAHTFADCFRKQAQRHPSRPALVGEDGTITYQEMDHLTDDLGKHLIKAGAEKGRVVAVLSERSVRLPETALAIWKTGAVYLPITASLPEDRMAYMCEDADPTLLVVLDDHEVPEKLQHLPMVRPTELGDDVPDIDFPDIDADDPAYILYTSGSTGTPKGVLIPHRGWNNFANGIAKMLNITHESCLIISSSPSFDAWNSDVGMCWTHGAAIYPITREQMNDIEGIKASLQKYNVTHFTLPPSYLRLFNQTHFPTLQSIMTIGEPPIPSDVAHYAKSLNYVNGYGPTENSGATALGYLTPDTTIFHAGQPMPNVAVYILDDKHNPVPPGSQGKIWTGGESLGIGYLNLPEKTDEVFVETQFGRLYDTGDLGRWTADGNLLVEGRADTQVKLRGQRVELGEIESKLEKHCDVQQAVALVETAEDRTQTLWAFVALKGSTPEPSQADWQTLLSQDLPNYMIPTCVIKVDEIPVNLSGKVDQKALLAVAQDLKQFNDGYDALNRTPPANDTERRIAQLWESHFPGRKVAREDDFFAMGGDSLRVIAVINALRSDYECSINDFYENPVLADFAACCTPRPHHVLEGLKAAKAHWQAYDDGLATYEAEMNDALSWPLTDYHQRNAQYDDLNLSKRKIYKNVLITGATGYLGAYLLRELMANEDRKVTALVRASDNQAAQKRLQEVLALYFGDAEAIKLANSARLRILSADLRQDKFGLTDEVYQTIANNIDAIYHSAANVNHFGHYHELYADNVTATERLLDLAATRANDPADFHHVSTISVAGTPPENTFELFSEYTPVPEKPAENYYIRTKQDSEKCVIAARDRLTNATIHRVGNIVFSAENPILQKGVKTNAFFRQLASFIRLGKVPKDLHVWLCHVDYLAKALVMISETNALKHETHHLEHHFMHTISDLLTRKDMEIEGIESSSFGDFIDHLIKVSDDPVYNEPLSDLVEAMYLTRGEAPQPRGRRLEVITERTQTLLSRIGFSWPDVPVSGLRHLLNNAQHHFKDDSETSI
ncbi:amino acid adenylation domain-containing protein [Terasakiella sp. A23]|uniref:non-ribosomal peptide synthetase n=1 Tax=Terasakiella sp. FCG-A23 TaxID=3080561 RepID=UPI0029558234|nr:non-ribosomal peptide synthetase [Terasakiella sp. A23]MDV7340258.1 amino acid adenylation domain-containing protein [Terasakiella sp. A23]